MRVGGEDAGGFETLLQLLQIVGMPERLLGCRNGQQPQHPDFPTRDGTDLQLGAHG